MDLTVLNEWFSKYNQNPLVMILGEIVIRRCLRGFTSF